MAPHDGAMDTHHDPSLSGERRDLLEALAVHRGFLLHTVRGLTDEQATARPTVSALCLGGIVKHVAHTEATWARFVVDGPAAFGAWPPAPEELARWGDQFTLLPGESLEAVVARYHEVAAATDALVRTVDLDLSHPLPPAPWFPPGAVRSARRVFVHIVAETAQHAGHADILRESIDGTRTMG